MPANLARVNEAARKSRKTRFTALMHHIDVEALRRVYNRQRRNASAGVDGATVEAYGENLEANLKRLCDRVHSGRYRPLPVRRAYPILNQLNGSLQRWAMRKYKKLRRRKRKAFYFLSKAYNLHNKSHGTVEAYATGYIKAQKIQGIMSIESEQSLTGIQGIGFFNAKLKGKKMVGVVRDLSDGSTTHFKAKRID